MKKFNLNIFGSTGEIGTKSINIINKYYKSINVNLILANNNYQKLISQAIKIKAKRVCILDKSKFDFVSKKLIQYNIKTIHPDDLNNYLNSTISDLSLLSISGYNALNFLLPIMKNTKILGIVNKESIVSAGHLFDKLSKKFKTIIFPLDSEHYSLFEYFNHNTFDNYNNIKNIYLTASGGPFYNTNEKSKKNFTLNNALNHPKWKMGYKNSIDSSTLANKCLEIIEANYLFNIPYEKLNIVIHPQALVHSIIEFKNNTSIMNYFYHDMTIPISNFFNFAINSQNFIVKNNKYKFNIKNTLIFDKPNYNDFPILKTFNNLDKLNPLNIIKFNCANEFAVKLFVKKMIKFEDINRFIEKSLIIDLDYKVNTISSIIKFHERYVNALQNYFFRYNKQ